MKQNQKLEAKFFGLFQVLHPISNQGQKLKISKRKKIHNVFHMLPFKQESNRKKQFKKILKSDNANMESEIYKIETIWDNTVYAKKLQEYLPGLYDLVK